MTGSGDTTETTSDISATDDLDADLLNDAPDAALDRITSLAASLLEVPQVFVSLIGDDDELIQSVAGTDPRVETGDAIPLDDAFARHILEAGESVVISETDDDDRVADSPARDEYDLAAYAGFPLTTSGGSVLGTLAASVADPRDWSGRDLDILENLAASAATELEFRLVTAERDHLRRKLDHASLYDSLTGLAARDLLRDRLDHALDRADRTGATIAVSYLDLDDFRRVNAELGREAGDAVLVRTAERLQSEARDQDTLGRLGRDQFAMVLEDVDDRDQVAQIAARLHDIVAEPVPFEGSDIECGASIGYLLTSPDDDPFGIPASTDPNKLLRMAEQTMHAAKGRGVPYLNAAEAQVTADDT